MTIKRDRLGRPNNGFANIPKKPVEFHTTVGCRLSKADNEALDKIAKSLGTKKGELMRTFIVWGIETEKREGIAI